MEAQQYEYARRHRAETIPWLTRTEDQYESFSLITRNSLHHTLADSGVSLEKSQIEALMDAYDSLSTFPDVEEALKVLSREPGITAVIFSNGTNQMVINSVNESPDLSPHASVFKEIVTVEEIKKFKPNPEVYYHLARKVGKSTKEMNEMWLVSGNPFDVVGARAVGMQAAWVDRAGNGWTDKLIQGDFGSPTVVVRGLGEVLEAVREQVSSRRS